MVKGNATRWKAIILVAGDNPRYAELVPAHAYATGYRVSTATDGAVELKVAETQRPDLVILDVMVPDHDGYEVGHGVREFPLVPIITLATRGAQSQRAQGLGLDAENYLMKPFGAAELVAQVDAVLRRVNRPRRGRPA
ncbi:MAG: response regulator [Firmicutes bacterium]|nr:response regulator [Bacillota bacterium]